MLGAVKRALASGGTLVMDLTDGDWMRGHFEARSWEWIDQNHFVCRERGLAGDSERLISREVVVHAERGVIADQFYAERLYSRDRIQTLLESVGFTNLRFHAFVVPDSHAQPGSRHDGASHVPDLRGAAEGRAACGARCCFPKSRCCSATRGCPTRSSANGQFNSEDLDTVARLKDALAEIPGYRFSFVDNHASLLADLRAKPAGLRAQSVRRGLQQRRLHGAARPGACWRCSTSPIAAPGRAASVSATTRRWCGRSPPRSTCRCRSRPISARTTRRRRFPRSSRR